MPISPNKEVNSGKNPVASSNDIGRPAVKNAVFSAFRITAVFLISHTPKRLQTYDAHSIFMHMDIHLIHTNSALCFCPACYLYPGIGPLVPHYLLAKT